MLTTVRLLELFFAIVSIFLRVHCLPVDRVRLVEDRVELVEDRVELVEDRVRLVEDRETLCTAIPGCRGTAAAGGNGTNLTLAAIKPLPRHRRCTRYLRLCNQGYFPIKVAESHFWRS